MSALKKAAGLFVGVSAMAALGVAIAQGQPPDPRIANPALGAGDQTVTGVPIGETGVLAWQQPVVNTAVIVAVPQVAQAAPEPAPAAAPEPAPAPVAAAPAPEPTQSMGAAPEPAPTPKADRG